MLKKAFFYVILMGMVASFSIGCNTYTPLGELEAFSYELENNSSSYTIDDWKAAFQTYKNIIASMEGIELSEEETHEFGRINGICTANLAKGAVVLAKDASNTGINFLDGLIEGFQSSFDEDFINDTFESLEDKIDGILEKYE